MRILVVNGSPRGARGNTDVLVQAFLEGARREDVEVDLVYLRDKKIEHCLGCFKCWIRTPGVCGRHDDVASILPLALPFMDVKDGISHHPSRYPKPHDSPARLVLISNSGFPEQAHFAGMKETMRLWCSNDGTKFVGSICCAGGAMLQSPMRPQFEWYLDATRQAGREVVTEGRMSPETAALLERPLVEDSEKYAQMINDYWASLGLERDCIDTP